MKKSLLALAVLGAFAGAASAQSSVTIYGLLDQGVQRTNGGSAFNPGTVGANPFTDTTAAAAATAGSRGRAYQLRQSSASRLGFRGNEDLGGGLSAQFQFEHRFTPDDGVAATPFWFGRSFVQLTSNRVGSVYLGRDHNPSFWIQLRADPFGNDGVGQSGNVNLLANYQALDGSTAVGAIGALGVRTANTIGYKSPSWGGLTLQVAGSANENGGNGRQYGANAEYLQGPIWAGVGYDKRSRSGVPAQNDNSVVNAGFAYDFGFVRPIVYYARSETGVNGAFDTDVWSVAATAPLAGGRLKAAYTRLDPDATTRVRKKLGLGYDYPLSKRTNLYADFGFAKEDARSNNKASAFGVKHTF